MTREEVVEIAHMVGFTPAHDYMVYKLYLEIKKREAPEHNEHYWDTERNK